MDSCINKEEGISPMALPFDVRKVYDLPGAFIVFRGFAPHLVWQLTHFKSHEILQRYTLPLLLEIACLSSKPTP